MSIYYTNGFFGFSGIRDDGSKIFGAILSQGSSGIKAELEALQYKSYSINVFDPKFPPTTLSSTIVAVDSDT